MVRDDRERLADILEAAHKIGTRVEHGRTRFDADEDLQIVLTHLVQVIGEAASRITPELTARRPTGPDRRRNHASSGSSTIGSTARSPGRIR